MDPKLANPLKMRLIAETITKTDKIAAMTHAIILRVGLAPLVHVPQKEVRELKSRIHNVLDRNHLTQPERTDIFDSHGRAWM